VKSPWFFYGAPSKVQQQHREYSQFALYNAVVDRFVVTFHDEKTLRKISVLWSNRCNLILCQLGQCDNFSPILIDNSVCTQWTVDDTRELGWTRFPDFDAPPYMVRNLKQLPGPLDRDDILFKNLEYLWASTKWIWTAQNLRSSYRYIVDMEIFKNMNMPVPLPPRFDLSAEIEKIIYRELDFAEACRQTEILFNEYELTNHIKINL